MVKVPTLILCVTLAFACASAAAAQPPVPKPGVPAPQAPPPGKPGPDPRPVPAPEPMGQPINVRVEITITDQYAPGEPLKKTVTMLAADRARSSVRNDAGRGFLNADVQPFVLPSGAVRLTLGFEYQPMIPAAGTESSRMLSRINEQVTAIVESGKPLLISQAADPTSERRVSVQVTATVVK